MIGNQGQSGPGRYRVYKTSNPKTNGNDNDWDPYVESGVVHTNMSLP